MLEDLYAGAETDALARLEQVSIFQLEALISKAATPIDCLSSFGKSQTIQVIAEIKRASPSKGDLAPIPDPATLAAINPCSRRRHATGDRIVTNSSAAVG